MGGNVITVDRINITVARKLNTVEKSNLPQVIQLFKTFVTPFPSYSKPLMLCQLQSQITGAQVSMLVFMFLAVHVHRLSMLALLSRLGEL